MEKNCANIKHNKNNKKRSDSSLYTNNSIRKRLPENNNHAYLSLKGILTNHLQTLKSQVLHDTSIKSTKSE